MQSSGTMSLYETLSVYIALGSMLAGIGAVIYVGRQVAQNAENTRTANVERTKEARQRRSEETMRFYLGSMEARERHETQLPGDREALKIRDLIRRAASDPSLEKAMRVYLSHLEILAIGVNKEVLDIDIVDRFAGGALIAVVDNYGPWIAQQREDLGSPTLYLELEWLVAALKELRSSQSHVYHQILASAQP